MNYLGTDPIRMSELAAGADGWLFFGHGVGDLSGVEQESAVFGWNGLDQDGLRKICDHLVLNSLTRLSHQVTTK